MQVCDAHGGRVAEPEGEKSIPDVPATKASMIGRREGLERGTVVKKTGKRGGKSAGDRHAEASPFVGPETLAIVIQWAAATRRFHAVH